MLKSTSLPAQPSGASSERKAGATPCACCVALDVGVGPGQVYNEEAFRYFLAEERRRSLSSNRPSLLLLLELQEQAGPVHASLARTLFSCLARCLRETDIMGWYHEGRVAGAVLTDLSDATVGDVPTHVLERVEAQVRKALPRKLAPRLGVRLFRVPSPAPAQAPLRHANRPSERRRGLK